MTASLEELHPYVRIKAEQLKANANKRLTGAYHMDYVQAYRSKAEQDALYAQGRTRKVDSKGNKLSIVTNAPGGKSMHNFGLAVDFALFTSDGKKVSWDTKADFDKDGKADWMEVVEEAKKLGFLWGGDWDNDGKSSDERFVDNPHFQMTAGLTDRQIYSGQKPNFGTVTAVKAQVPSVPKQSTPVIPYPGHLLKRGSEGKDVERVQRALGLKDDGDFGEKTETAVKAYQKKHGLKPDGEVGEQTWNVLF